MKKQEEEKPLQYFERNYTVLAVSIAITAILGYFTYKCIVDVSPWTFLVIIPTLIMTFQSLWVILNPYAVIYKDKFEIKRSALQSKTWYFIDIKNVSDINSKGFEIVYNDDDKEKVVTAGIRPSHKQEFRNVVNHHVCKSLVERED